MRDRGTGTLRTAHEQGWALGAFSTHTQEITRAIVRAAQETGRTVIVQACTRAFNDAGLTESAAQAVLAADLAGVPVGVHLDHSRNLDQIGASLAAGYTSVIVDGSLLPFEEIVDLPGAAVAAPRPYGAGVEAELGAVSGHEDRSMVTARGELTDPALAEELVARTGVDALAVAIGNVHGTATTRRPIDPDLLARLHTVVPVPLVLHGTSAQPALELVRTCPRCNQGERQHRPSERLPGWATGALPYAHATADVAAVPERARSAVRDVVRSTVLTLTAGAPVVTQAIP